MNIDITQESKIPRCNDCGYPLQGSLRGPCPECGKDYNLGVKSSYTFKPPFVWYLFWLPGLLASIAVGLAWGLIFYTYGNLGWGLFIGVPSMLGALWGYRSSGSSWIDTLVLLLIVFTVVIGFAAFGFAGLFCLIMLVWFFGGFSLIGLYSGMLLGRLTRILLKRTKFTQRHYLPILIIILLWPGILHLIEHALELDSNSETMTTSMSLKTQPERAYHAWMFYGDTQHQPPLLLRLGLPTPKYTKGRINKVGDRQTCIYTKGRLVKEATHVVPGETLAFDVVTQENIEDRSIRLIDGRFDFKEETSGTTRVSLTTRYEPLLTPRWLWRPIEKKTAHTMHRHILNGMQLRLDDQVATSVGVHQP